MPTFYVQRVIDGDTISVTPDWIYGGRQGDRVRLAGVYAPELAAPGGIEAKSRLEKKVGGKAVTLRNIQGFSYGRLVCDVYVGNRKVTN